MLEEGFGCNQRLKIPVYLSFVSSIETSSSEALFLFFPIGVDLKQSNLNTLLMVFYYDFFF
jgi:hypothetical protein